MNTACLSRCGDHRRRLVVSVCLLVPLVASWGCGQGIDPNDSVVLIYEVDSEELAAAMGEDPAESVVDLSAEEMDGMVQALQRRLRRSGVRRARVRAHDANQVEITIPDKGDTETRRIKKLIQASGVVQFRIVARPGTHDALIAMADQQEGSNVVRDEAGDTKGLWVTVPLDNPDDAEAEEYQVDVATCKFRDVDGRREVLVAIDPFNVCGTHISSASRDLDETGMPSVSFSMTKSGANRLRGLTSCNVPDRQRNVYYWLGIVLDGKLLTAPRIQSTIADRGRITGRFTQAEADFMLDILNAGRLPFSLQSEPVSETRPGKAD